MAIKKSGLYRSLGQSCDELRGGMDASPYKDYVRVLLFVKYVVAAFNDEDKRRFPGGRAQAISYLQEGGETVKPTLE